MRGIVRDYAERVRRCLLLAVMLVACGPKVDSLTSTGDDDDPSSDTTDDPTSSTSTTTTTTVGPDPTTPTDPPDPDSTSDSGPMVDQCNPPGAAELEVGHGAAGTFAPFADGAAQLVYGEQGGIHIDIGLRAQYLDVSGAFLSDIRGYIDGVEVAVGSGGTFFECLPDQSALVRTGIRLIFELNPADVDQRTVAVEAQYQDTQGVVVEANGSVLVVDPT